MKIKIHKRRALAAGITLALLSATPVWATGQEQNVLAANLETPWGAGSFEYRHNAPSERDKDFKLCGRLIKNIQKELIGRISPERRAYLEQRQSRIDNAVDTSLEQSLMGRNSAILQSISPEAGSSDVSSSSVDELDVGLKAMNVVLPTLDRVLETQEDEQLKTEITALRDLCQLKKAELENQIASGNQNTASPLREKFRNLIERVKLGELKEPEDLDIIIGHARYLREAIYQPQATVEQKYAYAHYLLKERQSLRIEQYKESDSKWPYKVDDEAQYILTELSLKEHPQAPYELLKLLKAQISDGSTFNEYTQNVFFELSQLKKDSGQFVLGESDRTELLMHAVLARHRDALYALNKDVQEHVEEMKKQDSTTFLKTQSGKKIKHYNLYNLPFYGHIGRIIASTPDMVKKADATALKRSIKHFYKVSNQRKELDIIGVWFPQSACSSDDEGEPTSATAAQAPHTFENMDAMLADARAQGEEAGRIATEKALTENVDGALFKYKSEAARLQTDINTLNGGLQDALEAKASLRQTIHEKEAQMMVLNNRLKLSDQHNAHLESQQEKYHQEKQVLTEQLAKARNTVAVVETDLAEKKAALRMQLDQHEDAQKRLREELAQARAQLANLETTLSTQGVALSAVAPDSEHEASDAPEAQASGLLAERDALRKMKAKLEARITALERDLEEKDKLYDNPLNSVEAMDTLAQEKSDLQSQMNTLMQDKTKLEADVAAWKKQEQEERAKAEQFRQKIGAVNLEKSMAAFHAQQQEERYERQLLARKNSSELKQKRITELECLETEIQTYKKKLKDEVQKVRTQVAQAFRKEHVKQQGLAQRLLERQNSSKLKTEQLAKKEVLLAEQRNLLAEQSKKLEKLAVFERKEREAQEAAEAKRQAEEEAERQAEEDRLHRLSINLGKTGELGFGVAVAPVTLAGFEAFSGTFDINSDEYGNYRHIATGGIYVYIPAFAYRVGHKTSAKLRDAYGDHALELNGLHNFNLDNCHSIADIQHALDATGEGWILDRAFINAGEVKTGFLTQKYLASPLDNRRLTSQPRTVPVSLTSRGCDTKSSKLHDCQGQLDDALVLAKNTDATQHVTSIFQYGALTKIALAQAQGIALLKAQDEDAHVHCAWWHKDPQQCSPRGVNNNLKDCYDDTLRWEDAQDGITGKSKTGSCSNPAKASHNGQANGVMDLNGCLWEVASGVTALDEKLYVLREDADINALTRQTAFTPAPYQNIPVPSTGVNNLSSRDVLFTGDAVRDGLVWPAARYTADTDWQGHAGSWLRTPDTRPNQMMPRVGGSLANASHAGLCARSWLYCASSSDHLAGVRLSAYGATWT